MKNQNARELDERIHKFLYRKFAEHPELRQDGRIVSKWRPSIAAIRQLAAQSR
ncbi:MAG TPA: hypothetical protein VLI54_04270 [Bacillota bacterium]|nr:hypothetical protein [Bacillota bacterium]